MKISKKSKKKKKRKKIIKKINFKIDSYNFFLSSGNYLNQIKIFILLFY
jgi:hypothetical protein